MAEPVYHPACDCVAIGDAESIRRFEEAMHPSYEVRSGPIYLDVWFTPVGGAAPQVPPSYPSSAFEWSVSASGEVTFYDKP